MNKSQLIEACQRIGELDGMGGCPLLFVFSHEWDHEKGDVTGDGVFEIIDPIDQEGYQEPVGPYLQTNDLSEWSSAKILARSGYHVSLNGYYKTYMLIPIDNQTLIDPETGSEIDAFPLMRALVGEQELANMLGIINLYEIDRPAYDKGMKLLLEKK